MREEKNGSIEGKRDRDSTATVSGLGEEGVGSRECE